MHTFSNEVYILLLSMSACNARVSGPAHCAHVGCFAAVLCAAVCARDLRAAVEGAERGIAAPEDK